ncbi:MAG: hypothetical protein U9R27_03755 [Campylobacterota bacterium]|nr:hypothetical protein [Campylobacterota bacterium]
MSYKKYLIIAIVALMFIFPDQIFPGLAGVMIIIVVLLLVIELGLDIYIVIVYLIQMYKEK